MGIIKRALSLLLVVFLAGCSGTVSKEAASTKGNAKIVVWHWLTDRDDAFNALSKKYKELTGIDVRFELCAPSDVYAQKVRGAAQTKTLPDIYGILAEKRDFAAFINAGHVLNLSPYMKADNNQWKNQIFEKALMVNEFSGGNEFNVSPGIYGVPVDVMNIQILYNKELFKRAGLDPNNPPKNWAEFMEAGKKLNAAGIQGLVSGWGEIWMIDCLALNYAYNIMGERKIIDTIKGEVAYTDPDWIKVFTVFKDMKDNHLLANGIVTMVNKHAEQMFANQRTALAFNGSWCVNVYYGMNPDLDYGAMLPPAYSSKHPMMIWGGAGTNFMINARSSKREMAVEFLRWLTDTPQQVYLAKETRNLPSNKDSLTDISPILAQFADDMERTTHPNNLPLSEAPRVIEARGKGIQSIIIGEKAPEEVALEVQSIKLKEMQKPGSK